MKISKKLLAMVMALLLALCALPVVSAAGSTNAEPGKTVSIQFDFSKIYGVDGEFQFSNRSLFSSVSYDTSKSGMGGSIDNDKCFLYGASEVTGYISVNLTVKPGAAVGDSCTITFTYETSDENGNMSEWKTATATVKVVKPAEPTTPPTKPTTPPTKPTTPVEPTKPTTPPTKPTTPPTKPTTSPTKPHTGSVDYTELLRQIEIGEGLKKEDYTSASWEVFQKALENAKSLTKSRDQAAVDNAAEVLAQAISALVKMDYSKLQAAIDSAKKLTEDEELYRLWNALLEALDKGAGLLTSGDQSAVDAAAAEINELIAAIQARLEELRSKEVIKEVPVEPDGPFCNIFSHRVWPILFTISAILNALFIALVVVYFVRRRKNQKDDTPLVDYQIGDDEP